MKKLLKMDIKKYQFLLFILILVVGVLSVKVFTLNQVISQVEKIEYIEKKAQDYTRNSETYRVSEYKLTYYPSFQGEEKYLLLPCDKDFEPLIYDAIKDEFIMDIK